MKEFIIAIGLLFFIEGILYALFPSKMKNMLKAIDKISVSKLRIGGLLFATTGFLIIWYLKR
jgi:uncharacterized protein YjeT (DUF2065 family)